MITNEHQSDMKMTSHMIAYLLNQVNFFYGNIKDLVSKELMKLVIIIDEVDGVERAALSIIAKLFCSSYVFFELLICTCYHLFISVI